MADIKQLEKALINADAAGDSEAARVIAGEITRMRAITPAAAAAKPATQQPARSTAAELVRQGGLTARYGLEGVGGMLNMLATPIRAGMNAVLPQQTAPVDFSGIADSVGLPKPRNPLERMVGDASRLVAGNIVPIGVAGNMANVAGGTTKNVLASLAAKPAQQAVSSAAAGGAGGAVRENGGNDATQMLASLAGGVAAPMAAGKLMQAGRAAGNVVQRVATPQAQQAAQQAIRVDVTINNALKDSGLTLEALPAAMRDSIRRDVTEAMSGNGVMSPDAVRRLADYRLTGTTPTRGTLTLDPAIVTQQKNLAKLGINSKDEAAQQLGRTENANNRQLIEEVNALGANTKDDALAGGKKVMEALEQRNSRAQELITARYDAARATDGRSAALDPHAFTNRANDLLDEALLGGKLPGDVRNLLNKAATGKMPLTVDVAEQFKTRIGELQRATTDMAERKALGLVRQALDDAPLMPGQEMGKASIDAFNKARRLNRAWMQIVEKTPALQAVRDGIEPDKFVQQFIVGGGSKANTADLQALRASVRANPVAMAAIKHQITAHLKNKAINGAADEVGNFSQSAYNKALSAIGDRKLSMFFKPEEVQKLRAIGRVASYEQFQPKGSAVNNSNTAAAGISAILDRIANSPLLSKVPFGKVLAEPVQNISVGIRSKDAMSVPKALALPQPKARGSSPLMLSPAAYAAFLTEQDQ